MSNPTTVIVIPADGSPMYLSLAADYTDLNRLANCEVGTVVQVTQELSPSIPNTSVDLWMDDEGLMVDPPKQHNMVASHLANQYLVGDAVMTRTNDMGESVDLGIEVLTVATLILKWIYSTPPKNPNCSLVYGKIQNLRNI